MTSKYDQIGHGYNRTRKADPYLANRLFELLSPKVSGSYLDIGCGTGNYTAALAQKGYAFIGIDPSEKMLEKARLLPGNIEWHSGKAEQTQLSDHAVDGIMGSLTIHHWHDLNNGFYELYRVLKPGGRLVIFTSTPTQMKGYWLNHYFPQMLKASIRQMPALGVVLEAMFLAGFTSMNLETYAINENLEDLFLYSGKYDPKRYFDPAVRKGISSFAALANQAEVSTGLQQLKIDIDTQRFETIQQSYFNKIGDYLFISCFKNL